MEPFKQFDIVQLTDTKDISFLSGQEGYSPDPNGYWSVVAFINGELMLAKEGTIIKAPIHAVNRVAIYSIDNFIDSLKMGSGNIDMVEFISNELSIPLEKSLQYLTKYHLPLWAKSEQHRDSVAKRIKKILDG